MPSATAKTAPTAKVSTVTTTKVVTDPVEKTIEPAAAPVPEPTQDFWAYIASLDPEDWNNHRCDLYRYPLGEVKPQKLGRYIKTFKRGTPLVSEEQILDEFGGGQYDAMLKRDKSLVARHSWEIEAPTKNPAANSGVPAAAVPSELAATLQVVLQNLKQASSSANPAESPAIKESISLIQQLTQAMPKQQGVGELVSALADLKKLTGGGDGGGNSTIETIKVLKELGLVGGERKSLASELKEILEISGLMGGGGGAPAVKQDWATSLITTLPTILEKATPIADKFADAARSNARVAELRTGAVPALPANRPAPALVVPPTEPAATAPAAESPAPRVVAMPETEPATAKPPEFKAPNLEWVKARAVQLFAAGKPGDAIAEWLDSLDDQLGNFLGAMDAEKFREFVKGDAILSSIATAPRFPEFVSEFVSYFSAEEPENKV